MKIVNDLLRGLLAFLCQFIYRLVAWLYELFMNVARVEILTTGDIQPIYQRVTMVLTIIMVFYVTFEAVKYVVQPDSFTDKEKGGGKLTLKMVIVVILIAFVPTIFTWAYKFQNVIFDNQVFSKIILGTPGVNTDEFGRVFSSNILSMFYKPNEDVWSKEELEEEGNCEDLPCAFVVSTNLSSLATEGELPLMSVGISDGDEAESVEGAEAFNYYIHFDGLLAVGVGIFVCYMLILYCIDAGVRVAQLTFLQIIAPIPIIGYLSPKKDGIFQKWLQQCITTYLDLFLRLAIIYFGLLVCQILTNAFSAGTLFNNLPSGLSNTMKIFIYIVLILGILMFLHKAPKLLQELFPQKGAASGNFGLKAGDRVAPLAARTAGAAIGGTLAGAKGLIGGTAARIKRNIANKNKRGDDKENYKAAQSNYKNAKRARRDFKRQIKNGELKDENGNVIDRKSASAKKMMKEQNQKLWDAKTAKEDAKAVRDNSKYRSVLGSAVAATVGGTYRGATTGVQATDFKGIVSKTKEGMKKEADAIHRTEQWYDSGGGSYIDRTITAVEKNLGINTSSDRIAAEVKRFDDGIKTNETLISAESDTKSKRDDVENRLSSKLESGELKATIGSEEEAYLRSKVSSDLDVRADDTVSSIYARYKAKHEEAKSILDTAIKDGKSSAEIDAARAALEKAADEETKMKKHAMRAAYTQMLKNPGSGLNDPVAENKLKTMKQSIENAKRSAATIRSFEEYTQTALSEALSQIENNTSLTEAQKQAARTAVMDKFDKQLKAFRGEIAFEDYDQLDDIVVRLQNIADERARANMAIKESKRKLESSAATAAAKADASASGGGK